MKKLWLAICLFAALSITGNIQAQLATLDVSVSNTGNQQNLTSYQFLTVNLPTVATDNLSGWNATTNVYTVPVSGLYQITSTMRLVDSTNTASFSQGVNGTLGDGVWMIWNQFVGKRTTIINTRQALLTSGQTLMMEGYCDSSFQCLIDSAHLVIQQMCTLSNCGGSGGGSTPGGATNSIQYNAGETLGGIALTSGKIVIGQATTPLAELVSGDCSMTNLGAFTCLKSNNVAFGTAAFVNTSAFDSAGAASTAQTAAQTFAANASNISSGLVRLASIPALLASGSNHAAGYAPDPGATSGTTRFLREDATWATPPSSGSFTLNTLSGAVTLAAGANIEITPSGNTLTITGNGSGGGSLPEGNGLVKVTNGVGGLAVCGTDVLCPDSINNSQIVWQVGSAGDDSCSLSVTGTINTCFISADGAIEESDNGAAYYIPITKIVEGSGIFITQLGNTATISAGTAAYTTLTDGSAITYATNGAGAANSILTLVHTTSTRTLNLTGVANGTGGVLILKEDSTGVSGTFNLGTGCTWFLRSSSGYVLATSLSLIGTPNAINILAWTSDGTNCYGSLV